MVGLVRFELSRPETLHQNCQRDAIVGRRATLKNAHRIFGGTLFSGNFGGKAGIGAGGQSQRIIDKVAFAQLGQKLRALAPST